LSDLSLKTDTALFDIPQGHPNLRKSIDNNYYYFESVIRFSGSVENEIARSIKGQKKKIATKN